jgi:phage/plasmid-associated DNA primase
MINELLFDNKYDDKLNELITKIHHYTMKQTNYKHIIDILKDLLHNNSITKQIDMGKDLIGFENGVYNVRTGEFRKGTMCDRVSYSTGYDFSPERDDKSNKEIMLFLSQIYPDKKVCNYMVKLLGDAISGKNSDNVLPICDGTGGNGKSVLKDLVLRTFGEYATELPSTYL